MLGAEAEPGTGVGDVFPGVSAVSDEVSLVEEGLEDEGTAGLGRVGAGPLGVAVWEVTVLASATCDSGAGPPWFDAEAPPISPSFLKSGAFKARAC